MDDNLEAELRALSMHLETPEVPDLTSAVRERLASSPPRHSRLRAARSRLSVPVRWRRWVYALVAALILTAATPQGRAFAEHLLKFAGVEFSSTPGPAPVASPSLPGEVRASLERARREVAFPILVPSALGPPDEVTVSDQGRVVTLRFGGIRLDEFDGRVEETFFGKFLAGQPERFKKAKVGSIPAIWILGSHDVWYIGRDGGDYTASARTAGNTLIWQAGASAMRLEGVSTLEEALRIAGSAS